ncbi:MAG TPA: ABC transporter, partial [Burkholderiaceae bacterium]|nr:ABC transporter [Burkholderiaceae bacterium]
DDYQKWLLEQSRETARAAREAAAPGPVAGGAPEVTANRREERKAQAAARQKIEAQAKPLKQEQARIERSLAEAQAEQARLLEALGHPDTPSTERAEQGRRLKQLEQDIETLETRWLELGEAIEQLAAG